MSTWEVGDEEITIEVDNRSGAFNVVRQVDEPSNWVAPVSGQYHFVSGQLPHLVENCTEECA